MDLAEYIQHDLRVTIEKFGESIDYSRAHISGIINGRLKPSKKFIKSVERVTYGKVTVLDLIKTWESK